MAYFMLLAGYTFYFYHLECAINSFGMWEELNTKKFYVTPLEALSFIDTLLIIYYYFTTKNWMINNVLAISFSIYSVEKIQFTKMWQIIIAFVCLIAYDVIFVFHSDVMMTVAKDFELPMKILIKFKSNMGMLGIGDVIVPGLLVSLCLRMDFLRSLLAKSLM